MANRGNGKVRGTGTGILRGVRYSARVSGAYYSELKKIVEYVNALFLRTIFAGLDTKQMAGKIKVQDESPNERYKKRLAAFTKILKGKVSKAFIEKIARQSLTRADKYCERDFKRHLQASAKSFGVDLDKLGLWKKYSSYMATAVVENVSLVQDLADEQARRLQSIVLRSVREGLPVSRTRGEIEHALGVGKRRAATIARTETHKLTQQLADRRAEDLGITRGVWRAVMDNRTSEQHARFNGKEFDLVKGLYDPREKSYNWPGRRVNCRCWTEYIIK